MNNAGNYRLGDNEVTALVNTQDYLFLGTISGEIIQFYVHGK